MPMHRNHLFLICCLLLSACEDRLGLAPVIDAMSATTEYKAASKYLVRPHDTLYAIAFRFDQDYQTLASMNRLKPPYTLHVGQVLYLKPMRQPIQPRTMPPVYLASRQPPEGSFVPHEYQSPSMLPVPIKLPQNHRRWYWPIRGTIASGFAPQLGRKGIDITGKKGDKVHAAAAGVIAYAGNGLSGYGNLIIIKHDHQMLTAYGHNAKNIVTEGQRVQAGQIIAEIGLIQGRSWGVHFETRQLGKPVNPLNYLQKD